MDTRGRTNSFGPRGHPLAATSIGMATGHRLRRLPNRPTARIECGRVTGAAGVNGRVRVPAAFAEELVVVEIVDGLADTSVVHQPVYPNRFNALDFPPTTWRSKCGVDGWVYAHAGELVDVPVCAACEAIK